MPNFKFLFEAHLFDGSVIQQSPDDVSAIDPTKSAFFDVVQRMDEVEVFGLFSDHYESTYLVDLTDGHFEINGSGFFLGDPSYTLPAKPVFRLVYFRRNKVNVMANAEGDLEPLAHDVEFFIGWQTTVEGRNYQEMISVH